MIAALGRGRGTALAAAAAAANGTLALVLVHRGVGFAFMAACAAPILLLVGRLAEGEGGPLFTMALALPMTWSRLTSPLPLGGSSLYPTDIVVGLVLVAWAASNLQRLERRGRIRWPDTPVLGAPLALFAAATLAALIRGHEAYGEKLFGQPTRLFFYAGVGAAVGGLDARRIHRIVTAVYYTGAVWLFLNGVYYIATGTSQSNQVDLSTGGTRVLAISASTYCAGALLLALLNLQLDTNARRRLVHATVAVVGAVGVLLGFGRAVIAATAVAALLIVALQPRVRRSLATALPLLLPALLLAGFLAVSAAPHVERSIVERISKPVSSDANVIWREKANAAVWSQVRSSPIIGVGFGRTARFEMLTQSGTGLPVPVQIHIGQDPHNGYLLLLAAGGVVLLGSFLVVVGTYAVDCVARYRRSMDPTGRLLVVWAAATVFVFLVNTASGVEFENATDVLTIWLLFLIPAAACPRRAA